MKTAILILALLIIGLSSCETVVKHNLPIEIVKLKESNQMDTLLVIKTNDMTYLFDKKEEYIGAYINNETFIFITSIILSIIFGFLIGLVMAKD